MPGFDTIGDIQAWQAARSVCRCVYGCTGTQPVAHDRAFCDQIRRAAVSVMSNIAEGFGRGTNPEFLRFLDIAKGSALEVESLLVLAQDLSYLTESQAGEVRLHLDAAIGRISGLQRYLRSCSTGSRRGGRAAERRTTNDEQRTGEP